MPQLIDYMSSECSMSTCMKYSRDLEVTQQSNSFSYFYKEKENEKKRNTYLYQLVIVIMRYRQANIIVTWKNVYEYVTPSVSSSTTRCPPRSLSFWSVGWSRIARSPPSSDFSVFNPSFPKKELNNGKCTRQCNGNGILYNNGEKKFLCCFFLVKIFYNFKDYRFKNILKASKVYNFHKVDIKSCLKLLVTLLKIIVN